MISSVSSIKSLRARRDRAAAEFENKVDNVVISAIAKSVFLERLRSRRILTMSPRPENRAVQQRVANQVRRTGRALGKSMCCGEPRSMYSKHMMEALEIILHRKGLK